MPIEEKEEEEPVVACVGDEERARQRVERHAIGVKHPVLCACRVASGEVGLAQDEVGVGGVGLGVHGHEHHHAVVLSVGDEERVGDHVDRQLCGAEELVLQAACIVCL